MRPHANLVHLEAGLLQTIAECLIGTGRPYGQYTSRPQRREGRAQTTLIVKPVIFIPGQSLWTIVDVQQDGIIGTLFRTQYPGNVDFAHGDPVVPERMAGKALPMDRGSTPLPPVSARPQSPGLERSAHAARP